MPPPESNDRPVARLVAAAICIFYGFAKLNGSQFTALDSELARPMGEVGGFWLTWYYFGYSPVYATLLALIEVIGGVMLVIPRTSLLAALMLFPVAANIVLIDVFYGVNPGGTLMAVILTVCLARVITPHAPRLREAVLPSARAATRPAPRHVVLAGALLAGAFAFTFWAAHYNNRVPTPIDGVWSVVSDTQEPARWAHVFFERNRAHMVVFRAPDGTDTTRHFLFSDGAIAIHTRWLDHASPKVMSGRTEGARIRLDVAAEEGGGAIELARRP